MSGRLIDGCVTGLDLDWTGHRGRITADWITATLPQHEAHFYLCAGQTMQEQLCEELQARGVGADALHKEGFGFGDAQRQGGAGFQITLENDGRCLPSGGTLLNALEQAQIHLDADCRAGECGKCAVRLLSGSVEWLAKPPQPMAQGEVLACCCRPCSDTTLALL